MTLLLVQNDAVRFPVVRRGRFALDRAALDSELHRDSAIKRALDSFIPQMQAEGFEYLGLVTDEQGKPKIEVLPHVEASDDCTPDPGNVPLPPFPGIGATAEQIANYGRVCAERERAAKRLVAQDMPGTRELVDVRVFVRFSQLASPTYRTAAPGSGILRMTPTKRSA